MKRILYILIFFILLTACGRRNEPSKFDLKSLESPVIFRGDSLKGYRDPAVLFHDNRFYLFFTVNEIINDTVYRYTAQSESDDLIEWTTPRRITPNLEKGYSSPGNVIRFKDEWVMCLQSYPRPNYTADQMPRYGDNTSRLYTMRSKDLVNWSEPVLMRVKGDIPESDMGRMIKPYLVEDKDEPGKWWCFYKQSGVSMAYSYDLKNWTPYGSASSGENVCVLTENNEYILFHSPRNGIGIKKSRTLQNSNWTDWGSLITLGQKDWEWARGRISGGAVVNLSKVKGINSYLMFFHGSGPKTEREGDFDVNSSIGISWSKDLVRWHYPQE